MSGMSIYITRLLICLLAMTGVLFLAFIVWRQVVFQKKSGGACGMEIIESLNISHRKTLFIVRVGHERFLIASDVDKTTFLAKLDDNTPDFAALADSAKDGMETKLSENAAKKSELTEKLANIADFLNPKQKFEEVKNKNESKTATASFQDTVEAVDENDIQNIKEKPRNVLRELMKKRSA